MSRSFHVVLPSNDRSFPDNKTNDFRISLPRALKFDGNYVCGLKSIVYPHSWNTLGALHKQHLCIVLGANEIRIEIPQGNYSTIEPLVETLNRLIAKGIEAYWKQNRESTAKRPKRSAELPPPVIDTTLPEKTIREEEKELTQNFQLPKSGEKERIVNANVGKESELKKVSPVPPKGLEPTSTASVGGVNHGKKQSVQKEQPATGPATNLVSEDGGKSLKETGKNANEKEKNAKSDTLENEKSAPSDVKMPGAPVAPIDTPIMNGALPLQGDFQTRVTHVSVGPPKIPEESPKRKLKVSIPVAGEGKFVYDKEKQKVAFDNPGNGFDYITLSSQLAYVLGFSEKHEIRHGDIATFTPDISGGIKSLAVYIDGLVDNVIVGSTQVPLLRFVNVASQHGENVEVIYDTPLFCDVACKEIDVLHVQIRTEEGRLAPFQFGYVVLTLVFKRILGY